MDECMHESVVWNLFLEFSNKVEKWIASGESESMQAS
jgi:hypothetical protein